MNIFLLFRNDYWHYGASVETLREFVDMFNAFIMENLEFRIVCIEKLTDPYKKGTTSNNISTKNSWPFHHTAIYWMQY